MSNIDFCPTCGTAVAESIKTSFDTFVEGYIYCWRCRTRIDLEVGHTGQEDNEETKAPERSGAYLFDRQIF